MDSEIHRIYMNCKSCGHLHLNRIITSRFEYGYKAEISSGSDDLPHGSLSSKTMIASYIIISDSSLCNNVEA